MARTDYVGTFKILRVYSFTVLAPYFVSEKLTWKLRGFHPIIMKFAIGWSPDLVLLTSDPQNKCSSSISLPVFQFIGHYGASATISNFVTLH